LKVSSNKHDKSVVFFLTLITVGAVVSLLGTLLSTSEAAQLAVSKILQRLVLGSTDSQVTAVSIAMPAIPSWYAFYVIAWSAIILAAVYGISSWKKWGVYLLIVGWTLDSLVIVGLGQFALTSLALEAVRVVILIRLFLTDWAYLT